MMTREEAIEYAESKKMRLEALVYNDDCKYGNYAMYSGELSFVNAALSALRPVSREQVEKVWKGEWIGDNDEKVGTIDGSPIKSSTCSVCGNWLVGSDEYDCSGHFCPACGRAMTDEAVQMVMERMETIR